MKTYTEEELREIFENCSFYENLVYEMNRQHSSFMIEDIMEDEYPIDWLWVFDLDWSKSELGIDYWEDVNDDWRSFVTENDKTYIVDYVTDEMYNKI